MDRIDILLLGVLLFPLIVDGFFAWVAAKWFVAQRPILLVLLMGWAVIGFVLPMALALGLASEDRIWAGVLVLFWTALRLGLFGKRAYTELWLGRRSVPRKPL